MTAVVTVLFSSGLTLTLGLEASIAAGIDTFSSEREN